MKNILAKFNSPAAAKSYITNAFKTNRKSYRAFLGDDELVWVVTMATGEKLLKQNYEEISVF